MAKQQKTKTQTPKNLTELEDILYNMGFELTDDNTDALGYGSRQFYLAPDDKDKGSVSITIDYNQG